MGKNYILQNTVTILWHYMYCELSTEEQAQFHPLPHPDPRYQNPHVLESHIWNGPVRSVLCVHKVHTGGWLKVTPWVQRSNYMYSPEVISGLKNKKERDHYNKLLKIFFK